MEGRGCQLKDRPWWDKLLDIIYVPYSPGCEKIGVYGLCFNCSREVKPLRELLYGAFEVCAAGRYEGVWRETILDCKLRGMTYLNWYLARNLLLALTDDLRRDSVLCVPVPGNVARIRDRGFSLPHLLAQELCHQMDNWSCVPDLIWQNRILVEQKTLDRHGRFENVRGSYDCRPLNGEKVVLVDDVLTTGATALEVAKTLLLAGAGEVKIAVLALAHRDYGEKH